MIEMTEQQRHELSDAELTAIDPVTRAAYVLVRRDVYERINTLLATEGFHPGETAVHINEVIADDDAKDHWL